MRLLIASNRLPFSVSRGEGGIELKPSSGGLVSGISSYLDFMRNSTVKDFEYLWIGWPGSYIENELQNEFSRKISSQHGVVPVFIPDKEMDDFYLGFCNSTIWPLFHYFPTLTRFDREQWETYKKINSAFAEAVLKVASYDDVIWIHDYHLMLVPAMLREKLGEKAKIGFFLHIPFPSFEVYRIMPSVWREEILKGLLGCDLIGFHTNEYAHSFLRSLLRILGLPHNLGRLEYGNRHIKVDTFPMGIDFSKFDSALGNRKVMESLSFLGDKLKGMRVIVSVDRLDYTKGVPNRLKAFRNFLKKNTEYIKKVVLILVIVPSRIGVDQYQEMKNTLDKLISDINGEFGTIDWQPIIYQYRHIPFEELVALYSHADVALITPLRDGMNLVAKEYLASKRAGGALILSEMAGAAKELPEAFIINPNDIDEISDAIKRALETDKPELDRNLFIMRERISYYNVLQWVKDFLKALEKSREETGKLGVKLINKDDKARMIRDFQKAEKRIIFLDYDGTLAPFEKRPSSAVPDPQLLQLLSVLSTLSQLCIVSGRDSAFLDKYFHSTGAHLFAEHGALLKEKNGSWQVLTQSDTGWKKQMMEMFKSCCARLPSSFVEEKSFSIALHHRNCDPEMAELRIREFVDDLVNYTSNLNLQVLQGNKVVEVRSYDINKANAGRHFLEKGDYDFILSIGDDWTDEDLFQFLRDKNSWTLRVGLKPSAAKFNILSIEQVREMLGEIANAGI